MIKQINQEIFDAVTTQAKEIVQQHGELTDRWFTAIEKAVAEIESNPFMHYDTEQQHLILLSQVTNKTYETNETCQCKAYYVGNPCYHRAAARLLRRYYEEIKK